MAVKATHSGTKVLNMQIKSAEEAKDHGVELGEGEFLGYASVFNNVDSTGDMVMPGAYTETLKSYGSNGEGVPVYWSHQMQNPMMNIGVTKSAIEDDHGLLTHVKLDLENPNAAYVHKLIKEGRVKQMSFAYDVEDYAVVETKDAGYYFELRKLKLHEVSVVPVGANQETELLAVKSLLHGVKDVTEVSSESRDLLAKAKELIEAVLGAELVEKTDEEKLRHEEPKAGKTEEPEEAKVEDQPQAKSADDSDPEAALALIELAMIAGDLS